MPRLSRLPVLALLLIGTLAGCPTTVKVTTPPVTAPITSVKNTTQGGLNSALEGVLEGFSGDPARLKSADASKITITVEDEAGKTIAGTDAVQPTAAGSFLIKNVPSGAYFVVATLPDLSTNSALLRTDQGSVNEISPGTSLSVVWAKNQLATKLLFVADLPFPQLLALGVKFDGALAQAQATLASSDDDRLKQVGTISQTDSGIKSLLDQLAQLLTDRATSNQFHLPPYTTQAEYDAKKKKLGLS